MMQRTSNHPTTDLLGISFNDSWLGLQPTVWPPQWVHWQGRGQRYFHIGNNTALANHTPDNTTSATSSGTKGLLRRHALISTFTFINLTLHKVFTLADTDYTFPFSVLVAKVWPLVDISAVFNGSHVVHWAVVSSSVTVNHTTSWPRTHPHPHKMLSFKDGIVVRHI